MRVVTTKKIRGADTKTEDILILTTLTKIIGFIIEDQSVRGFV